MKLYKRSNQYKNSTGTNKLDLNTMVATSYGWWEYVKPINGTIYFNDYTYSKSTAKHQYNMISLLDNLGVDYVKVKVPKGLQNLESGVIYYNHEINKLKVAIANPRSRKSTNETRRKNILELEQKRDILKTLINTNQTAA